MTDKPKARPGVMLTAEYAQALEHLLAMCRECQKMGLKDEYPAVGNAIRMALQAKERAANA